MKRTSTLQGKLARLGITATLIAVLAVSLAELGVAADLGQNTDNYTDNGEMLRWSGPYAGLHLGLSGAGTNIERGAGNKDQETDVGNAGFGAMAGYNFAPLGGGNTGFMMGLEADITALGGSKRKSDAILGTTEFDANWLASARVRAGYAWSSLYLYGTLGLALSDINVFDTARNKDRNAVHAGLAYGFGAELAVSENWSARLEAIAYDFGGGKQTFSGKKRDVDLGAATIRMGVSRRF